MSNQDLEHQGFDLCKAYTNKKDGEIYYLRLGNRPDADGEERPFYQLMNVVHFWEGDEAQFKAGFI